MDGVEGRRFASDARIAQKLIKRLKTLALDTKNTSKVISIIDKLYSTDQNVTQSLIFCIEDLIYKKRNVDAAQMIFFQTMCQLKYIDIKQCLDFIYSCDAIAINEESLNHIFEIHCSSEQYLAGLVILDLLPQDETTNEKRKQITQYVSNKDIKKTDIIYQNLANSLLLKKTKPLNKNLRNKNHQNIVTTLLHTPLVAWNYRNQLTRMISRDLNLKYQKSILGWLWGILEPLALTITFLFLFDILSTNTSKFMPLNIMIGIIIWSGFGNIMLRGTKSLESNSAILQRVSLPRQIFILNIAGTAVSTIALNIIAIIPLLIYYQILPTWKLILFPISLVMVTIYAISISLFTCTIQTKWRDVSHFVSVAVRIGFYFTPVFFTLDMLINGRIPPEFLDIYLIINPIAVYLTLARVAFTGESFNIGIEYVWISLIHLILLYSISAFWFSRNEDTAVKYL